MSGGKLIDARTAALLESFFLAPPFFTILPVPFTVFTTLHHIGEYVWLLSGGHGRIKGMQRKRGGLVPIGEALADLPGPVKSIRKTPPPARRGFTVADQVNQLVSASEADPDRGFIARLMALCCLPRTNPGNRKEYRRVNGPYTLYQTY